MCRLNMLDNAEPLQDNAKWHLASDSGERAQGVLLTQQYEAIATRVESP